MKYNINNKNRIKLFPINILAIILGLAGFTLALQKTTPLITTTNIFAPVLYITITLAIITTAIYIIKLINYPNEVKKEIKHPIKINFFPIMGKTLLILSIIYLEINKNTSKTLFIIGVILQLGFSILLISQWINNKHEWHNLNPSWFIPIVGNVIIPIPGVAHGFIELSWFFFAIGLLMWLTLFIIVFNRIIFHHPLPRKLIPTMFILFAPPAIAFIAYTKLINGLDPFGRILYYGALFLAIVIFLQVKKYVKLEFFISWWAYTFPTAALTIATTLMYHETTISFFKHLAIILLLLLTAIIIITTAKTIIAIRKKEICIEE